jgi:UDP-glucose 4-epimerase
VAGASATRGELHEPETHLIPIVLEAAAGVRERVAVYGTDYDTADGTAVRDYVHVEDLADAHVRALAQEPTPGHRVFNLGGERGWSVREVIAIVEEVTGRRVDAVDEPRRAGDPPVLVASSRRIRERLGWEPTRSDLHRIVADAWRWTESRLSAR